MTIIYCYDAYCNWCYGFNAVITKVGDTFRNHYDFEVLSGGLILPEKPVPVSATASYTLATCKKVSDKTGVAFGEDYLWHFKNPDDSDWFPNSEKPAVALCIFKEYFPERQLEFASDLLFALQFEGRDLCDNEAYRQLLLKYNIPVDEFYQKLKTIEYKEIAYEDFALVKQLKVSAFPVMMLQETALKFHLINVGYADYEIIADKLYKFLETLSPSSSPF